METMAGLNKRSEYIDFVRGIAIIAVTIGHVVGSYQLGLSWISFWVYSFELPAFFIISGWLAEWSGKQYSMKDYVRKQAKTVLYPYLMFSGCYTLLFVFLAVRKGTNEVIHQVIKGFLYTISGEGLGALWFMPTFFMATIIAWLINKVGRKRIYLITAITVVIASAISYITEYTSFLNVDEWTVEKVLWYCLSFISRWLTSASLILLGRLGFRFKNIALGKIGGGGATSKICCSILLIGIGSALAFLQYLPVDLHFSFVRNPMLFYMSAIFTVAGLLLLGTLVRIGWINFLGINSMIVMFCQIIQQLTCRAVNRLVFERKEMPLVANWFASILTVAVILICSAIIANIINHNKYFNLLIKPKRT